MKLPTYTVVIPTRNRPDTLAVTLRCLAEMRHPRLQVVIVNNSDDGRTESVLRRSKLPMTVIGGRGGLCMRDSWEYGLAVAEGDYITYIGDDDALMPSAVAYADGMLARLQYPDVLAWDCPNYWWPTAANRRAAGFIEIRLGQNLCHLDAVGTLERWGARPWEMPFAPSIYQAFVSRPMIQAVTARFGRYFWETLPDIGSALVNLFEAHVAARRIAYSDVPLSIRGISHRSIGQSFMLGGEQKTRDRFTAAEEARDDTEPLIHPALVPTTSMSAVMTSAWLRMLPRAAAAYGADATIDLPGLAADLAVKMVETAQSRDAMAEVATDARALLRRYDQPEADLDRAIAAYVKPAAPSPCTSIIGERVQITADLRPLGVTDTYGAFTYLRTIEPRLMPFNDGAPIAQAAEWWHLEPQTC